MRRVDLPHSVTNIASVGYHQGETKTESADYNGDETFNRYVG